jgi:hypothetical protein
MFERTTRKTMEEYRIARNEAKNMCRRKRNCFRKTYCKIFRINSEEMKQEGTTKAFITLNVASNRGQHVPRQDGKSSCW